jgi:DNA repair exonuclease SbcCD nuclease subunit
MTMAFRLLFLSDTHLGFDLPLRPRVVRRRRGPDFFASYERALEPAMRGEVDAVLHGGDLLYRRRVPADLVLRALAPLKAIADRGTPVFVVPGNHERSEIPYGLLARHPNLHIFDRPRSFILRAKGGMVVSFSGFPCVRKNVRQTFPGVLEETGWTDARCDVKLLCIHQTVEGARVEGHVFRSGHDVIRGRDIPKGLTAVLSGHIHRAQRLTRDLGGRALSAPVLYPGSTERTSFTEMDEAKGYLILRFEASDRSVSRRFRFHPLPTRPMRLVRIPSTAVTVTAGGALTWLANVLASLPADSIVKIHLEGTLPPGGLSELSAASIRRIAPPTMNVQLSYSAVPVDAR